jgi:hypothetical protein
MFSYGQYSARCSVDEGCFLPYFLHYFSKAASIQTKSSLPQVNCCKAGLIYIA